MPYMPTLCLGLGLFFVPVDRERERQRNGLRLSLSLRKMALLNHGLSPENRAELTEPSTFSIRRPGSGGAGTGGGGVLMH